MRRKPRTPISDLDRLIKACQQVSILRFNVQQTDTEVAERLVDVYNRLSNAISAINREGEARAFYLRAAEYGDPPTSAGPNKGRNALKAEGEGMDIEGKFDSEEEREACWKIASELTEVLQRHQHLAPKLTLSATVYLMVEVFRQTTKRQYLDEAWTAISESLERQIRTKGVIHE